MDMGSPLTWEPPEAWRKVTAIDSHTGGEPFRVVVDGIAPIPGDTVLERRRYAERHLETLRRILMWEPRGHADMYGCLLGPPVEPDSDISVLFIHNSGFSTMCGHGVIALAKVALDTGILSMPAEGDATIGIDTPAGRVTATASIDDGMVASVRFRNVPSFATDLGAVVDVPGWGAVTYDLAFGGAFYAYVDAADTGVSLSDAAQLVSAGRLIKSAIVDSRGIEHPASPDLGFLYGVIFTGPAEAPQNHSRNVCVFADGEIDRSPTGTGVSGRLAIAHARGEIAPGETTTVESIVGSTFTGSVAEVTSVAGRPAIVPEISGTAHITGRSEFWIDPSDEIGKGFFLR